MDKYRVMIVDDQNISRQLFESYVNGSEEFELAYSINSARTADIYCAGNWIDLVIMDVVMNDGSSGMDAAERIKRIKPEVKIIIVTSMPEVSYLKRAKKIGVESFWYKEAGSVQLIDVMKRTMAGESVYPESTPVIRMGCADSCEFTAAELMVLREMTTGASNVEIADKLCISVNTVKQHITHMLQKTGYRNRTELAIEARINGIVIANDNQGI